MIGKLHTACTQPAKAWQVMAASENNNEPKPEAHNVSTLLLLKSLALAVTQADLIAKLAHIAGTRSGDLHRHDRGLCG